MSASERCIGDRDISVTRRGRGYDVRGMYGQEGTVGRGK